ncbi:MAG: DUF3843 family protein [Phycisphaeraceae bacterium]|nr:DUF3843 family protein [Phycisphaeraceae bacterium]
MIAKLKPHRPAGCSEDEIEALSKIANELFRVLKATQASLAYDTLVLPGPLLKELSIVIVEFAEDLLNGLGIWESLEGYNHSFFGTPLPFSLPVDCKTAKGVISRERVHYLLWHKYSEFCEGLLLLPGHRDLDLVVEEVFYFFNSGHIKEDFPKESSVETLMNRPNDYGWDIKRKLLWLGRHSYLFRHSFAAYIEKNGGEQEIQVVDDFVCQHSSSWSGLGVPDILADILDISDDQREELRTWYLRHFAYYQIESIDGPILCARNTVCNKEYMIRAGDQSEKFKVGHVYLGGLVPWNGDWYWSGQQSIFGALPEDYIEEISDQFLKERSQIAYRYCDSVLEKARDRIKVHHQNFVDFHGDDLAVFPDGYAMAAALQKQYRLEYAAHPQEIVEEVMNRHNLKNPWPTSTYPPALLNSTTGVGVFFNQDEGQEFMSGFNHILQGFAKKGVGMTEDEIEGIRGLIESPAVSPKFVEKLVKIHGAESIAEAFVFRDCQPMDYLPYILRQYKGQYYRIRYPNLSFN